MSVSRRLAHHTSLVVVVLIAFNVATLMLLLSKRGVKDTLWPKKPDDPLPPDVLPVQAPQIVPDVVTITTTTTVHLRAKPTPPPPPPKPPGPAFCEACGPEDSLCALYGEHNLARSRVYEGANARFHRVIANALAGKPTKIGVLGGSVTKGNGLLHNRVENWTAKFLEAWKALFPKSETTLINGAVPATVSDYLSMCFGEHIDEDVDLVILELLINDQRVESHVLAYEWLLRGLLALPKNPAVLNLHTLGLSFEYITTGGDLHTPVAEYYDSPIISVRNMLAPHVLNHAELDEYYFTKINGKADWRHMGAPGHKVMADLLVAYTQRQICAVEKAKVSPPKRSSDVALPGPEVLETIPRLRLFQKYDRETVTGTITPMCQSIRATKHPLAPIENRGWQPWTHHGQRDKPYLVAREPGATVKFAVVSALMGRVRITYLRSKTFGLGDVWCWLDDNKRGGTRVASWWQYDHINVANVAVIAHHATPGKHTLTCEVMQETSDPNGGHEFRLIAVDAS